MSQGLISEDTTWTELTQEGNKPSLCSHHQFKKLVQTINDKTTGDVTFSTSEIRNEVENAIKTSFQK